MFCKQYKMVFGKKCWFRGGSKIWNFRKLNITRLTSHKMVLSKNIWSLGTLNYQNRGTDQIRDHVICYTVVHVTILVNFEFFADGRDMVVVSTNTPEYPVYASYTIPRILDSEYRGESIRWVVFVSNRTYVLLRYHFPVVWYSFYYFIILKVFQNSTFYSILIRDGNWKYRFESP